MTENKLTYKTITNTGTVGFDNKMGIADVMNVFQTAVALHTQDTCVGFKQLLENENAKWIISRIRFEIDRFPENCEDITVETWPLEASRLRFERCFELHDSKGIAVNAISDWVVIDADTSAPRRASSIPMPFESYLTKRCVTNKYSMVSADVTADDICYVKTIRVSDLDLNGHVNNISYIKMAVDCFKTDELEKLCMKSFEMYYKEQCFEGENVTLYRKAVEDGYYIEARKDETVVFKAVVNK